MPKNRNLMLKFRLVVNRPMRKSEALRLLKRAVRTGVMPEGIELRWLDWARPTRTGAVRSGGRINPEWWEELRAFAGALNAAERSGGLRVERA